MAPSPEPTPGGPSEGNSGASPWVAERPVVAKDPTGFHWFRASCSGPQMKVTQVLELGNL